MSYEIHADYEQRFLLPPDINEWIGSSHPARFVREFVDSLHMDALGFKVRESDEGRPNYSSELMLKIWLYGYMNKIRSSRGLEKACMNDIGMIWLTANNHPDHNSIWRFFRENKTGLKGVFRQSVKVACNMDLVGLVLNAVDGTKILADVSKKKSFHRADLEKLLKSLEDAFLEEFCEEIEHNEVAEQGLEYRLPDELSDRKRLRKEIESQLAKLDSAGANNLNATDEDARMIKTETGIKFSFNAQIGVDAKTGIIVSEDVVNDACDHHLLTGMIAQTEEYCGSSPTQTVADAGYFSGDELVKAEEKGYEVIVNVKSTPTFHRQGVNENEFHQSKFTYDVENDIYTCPKGGKLSFRGVKHKPGKTYTGRLYSCDDYKVCPFRKECIASKRVKTIIVNMNKQAIERQLKKHEDPINRALLKKRKTIVEPVFGHIKHALGFRRWTVRGLDNVRAQWSLLCASLNLAKMHRIWVTA